MSEPQLIGEILPDVMMNVENRGKRNQQNKELGTEEHRNRVLFAVSDFHKGRRRIPKKKLAVYSGGNGKQYSLWN